MPNTDQWTILSKESDSHSLFHAGIYRTTHPNVYLVRHRQGHEMKLLSPVGDYKPGSTIDIAWDFLAHRSSYIVDLTGKPCTPATAPAAAPVVSPGITIKPEIMVALTDVRLKGNFREAVGTIFYLPPDALSKQPAPLAASIKEGSAITIVTDVSFDDLERYRTFLQQAYGFANLQNVRLPGAVAGSTTITAEHKASGGMGYVSQAALDQAVREP